MEHTHPSPAIKAELASYKSTIEKYLPFVFVRCSRYTNSRRMAEIIAIYAFICAHRLTEILDGANKISVLLYIMVDVIGEDLGKGADIPVNGQILFRQKETLRIAKKLSELDTGECLDGVRRYMGLFANSFDIAQFSRITDTVMNYLIKWN